MGTGLGLAIVNSIVKSDGLNGKVDVFSTEGEGTEISVTFELDPPSSSSSHSPSNAPFPSSISDNALKQAQGQGQGGQGGPPLTQRSLANARVFMIGFDLLHQGQALLLEVLGTTMATWWGVSLVDSRSSSNILILNDDLPALTQLLDAHEVGRPVIMITATRGHSEVSALVEEYRREGGKCEVVYKPCRPSSLFGALEGALKEVEWDGGSPVESPPAYQRQWDPLALERAQEDAVALGDPSSRPVQNTDADQDENENEAKTQAFERPATSRRHSSDSIPPLAFRPQRPGFTRSASHIPKTSSDSWLPVYHTPPPKQTHQTLVTEASGKPRVLVVEDNQVNRALLVQWLGKKGYEYDEAVDGKEAVDIFRERGVGYFQYVPFFCTTRVGCTCIADVFSYQGHPDGYLNAYHGRWVA